MILNWCDGLSKNLEILDGLSKLWPGLDLRVVDIPKSRNINDDLVKKLNEFSPDLLLCNTGNPEQEILLSKLKGEVPSAKILVGIGGTIDYLINKKKSAPKTYSRIGLEWFWRLFNQPTKGLVINRKQRIYNAVIKFSISFFKSLFSKTLLGNSVRFF